MPLVRVSALSYLELKDKHPSAFGIRKIDNVWCGVVDNENSPMVKREPIAASNLKTQSKEV